MMTPPRFTLSTRMLPVSRRGIGEVVGGCGCCRRANVSRGIEGCGIGVAPGTMRPPNGDDGMLLLFVSRG